MQTLWASMQETEDDVKNGINECANTLVGKAKFIFICPMNILFLYLVVAVFKELFYHF